MSHKANVYFADVYDRMEYILASSDMVAGITKKFMNHTSNMASYEMNQVIRDSIGMCPGTGAVPIICLPLTLLTGYFGMNFTRMWSVNHNSDLLFWEIAIPIILIVVPLFMWGDKRRMRRIDQVAGVQAYICPRIWTPRDRAPVFALFQDPLDGRSLTFIAMIMDFWVPMRTLTTVGELLSTLRLISGPRYLLPLPMIGGLLVDILSV
ncbi:hypothetical protein BD310DRAFT_318223 [Dichomitus squalens]|uniref:Uncharacterized protein n=1 Tax=Dichomitus squalens TaxID=114155 RepID=A0A4V6MWL2_9APHY|nr:hypothetical protein BD310DRAFT_318223 [Dichomitus squalens]